MKDICNPPDFGIKKLKSCQKLEKSDSATNYTVFVISIVGTWLLNMKCLTNCSGYKFIYFEKSIIPQFPCKIEGSDYYCGIV